MPRDPMRGPIAFLERWKPWYFSLVNLIVLIICAAYGTLAYQSWQVVKKNPDWFDEFPKLWLRQLKIGFGASFARVAWSVLIALPLITFQGWWLFAIGICNLAFEIPLVNVLYNGEYMGNAYFGSPPCSSDPTDTLDVQRCTFYVQYAEATGQAVSSVESVFFSQNQLLKAFGIVALAGMWIGVILWAIIGSRRREERKPGAIEFCASLCGDCIP